MYQQNKARLPCKMGCIKHSFLVSFAAEHQKEESPFMKVGLIYTSNSIVRVFLITAATFGGMSLLGYTTKKDLTKIGSFMIMGLWGIIIASIVNIFLKSSGLYFAISYIAVLVFTVLTAYDVQKIKNMYYSADSNDNMSRKAIAGAMSLYLDFINLFIYLMRIMGDRK